MTLDRLEGDVQLAGDLAVGAAVGGQPGDAQLAGGQRVHPGPPRAPRAGAGRPELVAGPGGQRPGAAAGGELERPGQRVPGRGALAVPAQGRAEFGQRAGALEQRGGVVKRGHRLAQQGQAFRAAAGQPGDPQRDPERARRAEHPHVGEFGVGQPHGVLALAQPQQRERGAGACVHVTRLADRHAPHVGAEQLPAGLEVGQRLGGPALRQPQASAGGRDEHRPDARGPALRREQVQQHLRLVKLARLDGDVGKDGRGEPESRREVTFLQHVQRHPRRRVGLGQRAEPQLEQAEGGVGGHQAAGRAGAVNLLEHRLERRLDRAETLGHDQDPQQRRSRIPVLRHRGRRASASPPAGPRSGWPGGPPAASSSPARPRPVRWRPRTRREPRRASTGATRGARRASCRPQTTSSPSSLAASSWSAGPSSASARSMTSTASTHRNRAA